MAVAPYVSERIDTLAPTKHWYTRPFTLGWALALGALIFLGIMFAIGLTLHEAYDAQVSMGGNVSPPPFNALFESIHNLLAAPNPWMWGG